MAQEADIASQDRDLHRDRSSHADPRQRRAECQSTATRREPGATQLDWSRTLVAGTLPLTPLRLPDVRAWVLRRVQTDRSFPRHSRGRQGHVRSARGAVHPASGGSRRTMVGGHTTRTIATTSERLNQNQKNPANAPQARLQPPHRASPSPERTCGGGLYRGGTLGPKTSETDVTRTRAGYHTEPSQGPEVGEGIQGLRPTTNNSTSTTHAKIQVENQDRPQGVEPRTFQHCSRNLQIQTGKARRSRIQTYPSDPKGRAGAARCPIRAEVGRQEKPTRSIRKAPPRSRPGADSRARVASYSSQAGPPFTPGYRRCLFERQIQVEARRCMDL